MTCGRGVSVAGRAVLLTATLLSGCGGGSFERRGFINHTRHSDQQLWTIWGEAQQSLSRQVDLNPLQREQSQVSPQILPGDPRALSVLPQGLVVASEADVSSTALFADTGERRIDPTGLVECPQPCNVRFAPAYSLYQHSTTRYASSWESSAPDYDYLLRYEFENQILSALGYDMRWR